MVQQAQQQPSRRPRPQLRSVRVRAVTRLTPHMIRVTVASDELAGFTTHGPAEHIKVFFPAPGQDRPVLPTFDADGRPMFPPGAERPISRTYTPRHWRPEALELDIDFLLHGDGPGARWAQGARPGDVVVVTSPGGPFQLDPQAGWYFIAGDDCALPAIGTILASLPASVRADVYVEVEAAAEEQPLPSEAHVQLTWLHRDADPGPPGRVLEARLRHLSLPEGRGRVFVACEASVMRDVRRHLLFDLHLDREAIHTHGYWKQDVANHPDHDLGQDV